MSALFDGVADYLKASITSKAQDTGEWTAFLYWKSPATVDDGFVIGLNKDNNFDRSVGALIQNGNWTLGINIGSDNVSESSIAVAADTWVKVAVVKRTGDDLTIHINTFANSYNASVVTPGSDLLEWINIGARDDGNSAELPTEGSAAYGAFWPTALSQSDLEEILNSGINPNDCTTAPAQYWNLIADANSDNAATNLTEVGGISYGAEDPLAGFAIDSAPASITNQVATSFTISGPAANPTPANTTIEGVAPGGVTGSDPYDLLGITFPRTFARQFDSVTGEAWNIVVGGENVDSAAIPYLPPTGYDYIDLVSPVYADNSSLLFGYTGDAPVAGDQLVAAWVSNPESLTLTLVADGTFTLDAAPTQTATITRYVVQADGTVGSESIFTILVGGSGGIKLPSVRTPFRLPFRTTSRTAFKG